jgi:hypothetical protein
MPSVSRLRVNLAMFTIKPTAYMDMKNNHLCSTSGYGLHEGDGGFKTVFSLFRMI